jgi:tRNA (cytidine/uridine-2'-O-)-methyltransferase
VTAKVASLHIVLVHPEIHWNTGNVGRTCLGAGAQLHLVEPLGFSLDAREVRRSGLDYWPRVNPRVWPDWPTLEAALPDLGSPYFFSAEATQPYWDAVFTAPTVLVFGCESVGLPKEIRDRYRDRLLRIPMQDPGLRSLNLGTCVGIAAFEALRQMRSAAGQIV